MQTRQYGISKANKFTNDKSTNNSSTRGGKPYQQFMSLIANHLSLFVTINHIEY
jgi:hypothetical protein